MENPFSLSLKRKTTGQTPNNFTIIKSITIIFVYISQLKKKKYLSYFSLLSHMQIIFLHGDDPFFFYLFTTRHPPLSFTVRHLLFLGCVLLFSTPHACLLYIEFYRLTLLGTYKVLTFHVSPISS